MRRLKKFFRGCLSSVFFVLYGAGSLAIGFGVLPLLILFGPRMSKIMRTVVRLSYRFFVRLADVLGLFRVEIGDETREVLERTRGHIVVANHPTLIDIVILAAILPDSTGFAKAEAAKNFFYSRIVKSVFIPNDDPAGALESSVAALKSGVNVIIFPQGTRTPDTQTRKLHRGAANIALRSGTAILPLRITPSVPVLGKSQPWYDVGETTVVYRIEKRDIIRPRGEPGHAAAKNLTKLVGEAISPGA